MMKLHSASRCALACALLFVLVLPAPSARAAKRLRSKEKSKPVAEKVELFAAMKAGKIETRFIPKDAASANVLIKNKTDKPLEIEMPEAFAGVPVLAQGVGFPFALCCGPGGNNNNNRNQGVGGAFPGNAMGMNFGMGMRPGGIFHVGAEKIRKVKVKTVCLEHGKPDPNPRVKYKLVPIESFTDKAEVIELCKMLSYERLSQNAAQAAAWHLANGVSWRQLAAKDRTRIDRIRYVEKFFTAQDLTIAKQTVGEAFRRAGAARSSFGKRNSLSQR